MRRSHPDLRLDPSPNHIPLKYLKGLVPKLWFYEAEPELPLAGRKAVIQALNGQCDYAVDESVDSEPLDVALRTKILANLGTMFGSSPALAILPNLGQFINCEICAGEERRPCYGDVYSDPTVVANPGHCITPLHRLFSISYEFARRQYRKYAPNSPEYKVFFHTRHVDVSPQKPKLHDIPVDYHVIGGTSLSQSDSAVLVDLNYGKFDAETFRAVMYVLFHECICHAFQGSVDKNDQRSGCGAADKFGEGWMDWVASELLQEFLNGQIAECADLLEEVPHAKDMAKIGDNFHYQRKNWRANTPSEYAVVHHCGITVAECVLHLLADCDVPDPYSVFRGLSFRLNSLPATREERRLFMENLERDFAPYCFAKATGKQQLPSVAREFRRYAEDGDAARLFKSILQPTKAATLHL